MQIDSDSVTGPPANRQSRVHELTSMRMALDEPPASQNQPKHTTKPGSMMSILNDDPPPRPQSAAPGATATAGSSSSRQIFDPIRGYDPVRETMLTRDPYGTGPLGSPRAPSQVPNRASASPSIASLVDPPTHMSPGAPHQSYNNTSTQPRFHDSTSLPPSPSQPTRTPAQPQAAKPAAPETKETKETKRPPPPPPAPAQVKPEPPKNAFTSMTTIPSAATSTTNGAAPASALSKKLAAVAQQDRDKHHKASTASSSSHVSGLKDTGPAFSTGAGRSILDFGKASPGEEFQAPSIVLHIPLNGETNKYVNFMRLAEERFGWDALHPRLAAHRERKARIAAASAALEKTGSGRESGDEMSVDLQSDGEGSNAEMGGMGNGAGGTSGPDGAPAKPARKKRNFKEDEYDKADDFVDDSELLWEEQAAASRDGFFVYSGPLVPEVEKPAARYVNLDPILKCHMLTCAAIARLQPVAAEAGAEVVAAREVAQREAKVRVVGVVVGPGPEEVPSLASPVSQNSRRSSAIAKRQSGRSLLSRPPSLPPAPPTMGSNSAPALVRITVLKSLPNLASSQSIIESSNATTYINLILFFFLRHTEVLDKVSASSNLLSSTPRPTLVILGF